MHFKLLFLEVLKVIIFIDSIFLILFLDVLSPFIGEDIGEGIEKFFIKFRLRLEFFSFNFLFSDIL